jgi:hypothetical protein
MTMGLTLDVHTNDTMELAELVDFVEREIDVTDQEALKSAGPQLLALANNRRVVVDKLNEELLSWRDDFQATNGYTAQTMMLHQGKGFLVRANIWTPFDLSPKNHEWQQKLFLYTVAHDHNFDLLTVGHYGPGYETDLYEYDRSSVIGLPGEPVDLVSRGRATLATGTVMFYRAIRDVHAQLPPKAFSISINLMGSSKALSIKDQYYFDVERSCIRAPVESGVANRVFLCEAARYFGDERTTAVLEQVADTHPCGRTRISAIESLGARAPAARERLWTRAADAPDRYVSTVARRVLGGIGAGIL